MLTETLVKTKVFLPSWDIVKNICKLEKTLFILILFSACPVGAFHDS